MLFTLYTLQRCTLTLCVYNMSTLYNVRYKVLVYEDCIQKVHGSFIGISTAMYSSGIASKMVLMIAVPCSKNGTNGTRDLDPILLWTQPPPQSSLLC